MAEPKLIKFPAGLPPTTRNYRPGRYPQKIFESVNGATVNIRYGKQVVDAELEMTFANIPTEEGELILQNYYTVNSAWNYVDFSGSSGLQGTDSNDLKKEIRQVDGVNKPPKLRWRYAEPPSLDQSHAGLCTVSCRFRGFLDG